MSNPFLIALKTNPGQFLGELGSDELHSLAEGCIKSLVEKSRLDDKNAAPALQALYRSLGEIEL